MQIINNKLLLLGTLSLVSTYLITKFLIIYLKRMEIIDKPDGIRKLHKNTTPRGGGLAIIFTLIVGLIMSEYYLNGSIIQSVKILPIVSLIGCISFIDDITDVAILVRLFIHLICAACTIFLFLFPIPLFHHELAIWPDFILAVISFTAFINIYNFLDGMDGLGIVQSIHICITLLILCCLKPDIIISAKLISIIITIILGSSIALLAFNWPPAKIFLGDVGSIGLGFILGFCLLMIAASSKKLFAAVAIANLYYLADGGGTILIRLINREKIWQPHLKHFFQKALKKGKKTKVILKHIIFCNFLLMLLAINALYSPVISIAFAITLVLITLIYLVK